ncbi:type-4 ice-structuring protein-like [Brachionichthys hirsutus]|uniref:type-4 ice-structuring protein-like n=1 Tax=Brachionichthys hirsutus TaxID=412623 RepID=UPI0036043CE2
MKSSLIVAVVLFALAQGSLAQEDAAPVFTAQGLTQRLQQLREGLAAQLGSSGDAASGAQQLQSHVETFAAELRGKLATLAAQLQQQAGPLAESVPTEIQAFITKMQKQIEEIVQQATDQAKAIGN